MSGVVARVGRDWGSELGSGGVTAAGKLADQHFYRRGDSTTPAQRVCRAR